MRISVRRKPSTLAVMLAAALGLGLSACGLGESTNCITAVAPAVEIEVRDSITSLPAAYGAAGTVVEGSFVDSLRVSGLGVIAPESLAYMRGANERAGTYLVSIAKPGYLTWQQAGVQVDLGTCHVETAHLVARLSPTP